METIKQILSSDGPRSDLVVRGWVRTHRQSKNISFIELYDGSSIKGLQLVIDPSIETYKNEAPRISTGASLLARGELVASPAKGQKFEFQVGELQVVGEASADDYPLQKKGHTLEFLREQIHLRGRSNTIGAVMRIRSVVSCAIHRFFHDNGFYYLHTPIVTTSDCEGAGEMFKVTTLDLGDIPRQEGKVSFKDDFFHEPAHLTVSGQLEAEIYAMALGKVYTFGPTFRAENSNTTRHLSEFWMIEPEVAFNELPENMQLAEDFVRYLIRAVLEECREDIEFLHARDWADKTMPETLAKVAESKFAHLDYTEAIKILEKSGQKFEYPVKWGMDLQSEHERFLSDQHINGPVIVVNYPKEIKAFYMRVNEDGRTVRAMDVLLPRLGEVIGGSQREERYDVLRNRILECDLPVENYWWYLDLRKYGSVPHSGFGFGLERFIMYVTGMHNIRDVIPFPRFPGFAKF